MSQRKAPRRTRKKEPQGLDRFVQVAQAWVANAFIFLRSARIQRRPRRMQLVERLALSNKHSVALLRVDSQEFVIGCTGESMVLLGVKEPQQEAVPHIPTTEDLVRSFRSIQ